MGDGVKLPVIETVKLTARWALAILLKHWMLFAAFVLVPVIAVVSAQFMILPNISIQPMKAAVSEVTPLAIVANVVFSLFIFLLLIIPALATYNEILRGTAGLNAATLGRYGGRIFGYVGDVIVIMLIVFLLIFLAALVGGIGIAILGSQSTISIVYMTVVFFVLFISFVCCLTRFSLRLPSRAVGEVMPWKAVWALGRGNTLRLFGGQMLVFIILLVPALPIFGLELWLQGGMMVGKPPTMLSALAISVASSTLIVVQTVFVNAFAALAYAYLRNARPDPIRAEPRF